MEVFANHLICLIFSAVVYQVAREQIESQCVYADPSNRSAAECIRQWDHVLHQCLGLSDGCVCRREECKHVQIHCR